MQLYELEVSNYKWLGYGFITVSHIRENIPADNMAVMIDVINKYM
jgi:hypothetical protein